MVGLTVQGDTPATVRPDRRTDGNGTTQISQGAANGQQFRTAPLWGVGKRLFFLHDGRTSSLLTAIQAHASTGSEANHVISNFNLLSASDRQAILVFLRSL